MPRGLEEPMHERENCKAASEPSSMRHRAWLIVVYTGVIPTWQGCSEVKKGPEISRKFQNRMIKTLVCLHFRYPRKKALTCRVRGCCAVLQETAGSCFTDKSLLLSGQVSRRRDTGWRLEHEHPLMMSVHRGDVRHVNMDRLGATVDHD